MKNNDSNPEYNIYEIQGKHGMILLHVPKRKATQEEKDELYRTVAQVIVNIYKEEKAKRMKEKEA